MTVLLVLFMLISLLTADFFVQRRKERKLSNALIRTAQVTMPSQWRIADDLVLAPNHVWMRKEKNGFITVGVDNFLLGVTGALEHIELPEEGAIVGRGESTITLREKNKAVRLTSPIEGQVVSINKNVAGSPSVANADPYTAGWLFNLIPSESAKPMSKFLRGDAAAQWLKQQYGMFRDFLAAQTPQLGLATLQDGGVPVDGVLKGFDREVWNEFEQKFARSAAAAQDSGEYDNA